MEKDGRITIWNTAASTYFWNSTIFHDFRLDRKTTTMAQDTVQTIRELEASIDKNVQNTNGTSWKWNFSTPDILHLMRYLDDDKYVSGFLQCFIIIEAWTGNCCHAIPSTNFYKNYR